MTDTWDPSIPSHKALAHEIEYGNGIPEMRPLRLAREALKTVGFEIEHEEDLADRPDDVPWYYPLEGDIWKAQTFWDYLTVWRMSWSGKLVTHNAIRLMEFVGLLPKGTWQVGEALKVAAAALVKGGQTKVCTHHTSYRKRLIFSIVIYANVPRCLPETRKLINPLEDLPPSDSFYIPYFLWRKASLRITASENIINDIQLFLVVVLVLSKRISKK